jgi:hypothetical protein
VKNNKAKLKKEKEKENISLKKREKIEQTWTNLLNLI